MKLSLGTRVPGLESGQSATSHTLTADAFSVSPRFLSFKQLSSVECGRRFCAYTHVSSLLVFHVFPQPHTTHTHKAAHTATPVLHDAKSSSVRSGRCVLATLRGEVLASEILHEVREREREVCESTRAPHTAGGARETWKRDAI